MSHKAIKLNDLGQVIYEFNEKDKPLYVLSDSPDWFSKKMLAHNSHLEWNKNTVTYYFNDNNEMEKVLQKIRVDRFENIGFVKNMTDDLKVGIEVNCVDIRDNKAFFLEKKDDTFNIKSRIEILDDLAIKFGKNDNCQSFEDFYCLYNFDANLMIIRQAMAEYELQGINDYKSKKSNNNGISNPTHNELIFRDFIRANQLTAKWHEFIKENPLSEPETSAKNYVFTEQEVKDLLIKTLTDLTPKEKEYNNDLFEGDVFKSKDITEAIEFGMKKASNLERLVYLRAISEVQDKIDNAKKNIK